MNHLAKASYGSLSLFSILGCFALAFSTAPLANAFEYESAGFRLGLDDEDGDNFIGYEVYGTLTPVWSFDLCEDSTLTLNPETAVGIIRGNGDTSAYLRLGAAAVISLGDLPLSLTINTGIQVLSEDTFGDYDIGGNFNFSSGIGFDWAISEDWVCGYRFQHTSNAHLYEKNPGLDLHSLSIGYRF